MGDKLKKRRQSFFLICLLLGILLLNPTSSLSNGSIKKQSSVKPVAAQNSAPPVYKVDTGGRKLVALTFDDGPDPLYTKQILDVLSKYHVKATFFVIGRNARLHPELLFSEIAQGHKVENHTTTHPDLPQCSREEVAREIAETDKIIRDLTHRPPHYFRPPKKLFNQAILDVAAHNGYKTVLWSVCVENRSCKTPEEMALRVINRAEPGIIILAHDGNLDRSKTVAALPIIINAYQEAGYTFVTLDELLAAGQ